MIDRSTGEVSLSAAGVEKLSPEDREKLLGELAITYGLTNIKLSEKTKSPADVKREVAQMVLELPDDVEYGYFTFEDLREFLIRLYDSDPTKSDRAIDISAGKIWSWLQGRYGYGNSGIRAVGSQSSPQDAPSSYEVMHSLIESEEQLTRSSRTAVLKAKKQFREEYAISLDDALIEVRKEADSLLRSGQANFHFGVQLMEQFGLFAGSKISSSEPS